MEPENSQLTSDTKHQIQEKRRRSEDGNRLFRNSGGFVAIEFTIAIFFIFTLAIAALEAQKAVERKKIKMIENFQKKWRGLDEKYK